MNRTLVSLVLVPFAAAGIVVGCVGDDPASSGDAGTTPTGTTTTTSPTATATDAAVPDTSTPPDAATTDAATDAPPPFSPTNVAGLVLWLDPTSGLTSAGGKVSAWADRSTSAITVSQTAAASQPSVGSVGSKPVVAFGATSWLEAAGATVGTKLDFGTGDVLVEAVVSVDAPTGAPLTGVLYKGPAGGPTFDGLQLYGNLGGGGKPGGGLDGATLQLTAPSGNTADGKLHMLGFRRAGTKLSLRYDGAEVAMSTMAARSTDNTLSLLVGGRPDGVHGAPHKTGDVLIYKGTVSDADVARIEAFMKQKSGI